MREGETERERALELELGSIGLGWLGQWIGEGTATIESQSIDSGKNQKKKEENGLS